MDDPSQNRQGRLQYGFSLLEVLIAMVVGFVVVGAGFMLFQQASATGRTTMSKTEMEQNGRAALNLMMQDISMANNDYQVLGVGVPQTGALKAVFGCAGCNTSTFFSNMATPIIPYDKNSLNGTSDTITVIYEDTTWPPTPQNLANQNNGNFVTNIVTNNATAPPSATISTAGDQVTITTASFPDANGVQRNYQDALYGSKVGDVMLVQNTLVGSALATVTAVKAGGVLSLSNGDSLNLNQTAAVSANVAALKGTGNVLYPASTAIFRVKIVTYFVQNTPGPDGLLGTADDIPVLMRQVNADPAGPQMVADYVQNLQLTYDLYDQGAGTWLFGATGLGGNILTEAQVTQIRKINIALQSRSQYKNSSGNYDTAWVSSSVAPRDLSFTDRYSN